MHAQLGVTCAVVVQPGCHGFDNLGTLDAIAATHGRYRGVALVAFDVADDELARLDCNGMRAVRFDIRGAVDQSRSRGIVRLSGRLRELGWHIVGAHRSDRP